MLRRVLLVAVFAGCSTGPAIFIDRAGIGRGEVVSEPSGLHCSEDNEDCAMIVEDGTITLIAQPGRQSKFAGWNLESCEGERCTLPITEDLRIGAQFDLLFRTLSIKHAGSGSGWVTSRAPALECNGDCEAEVLDGGPVTLEATPVAGSAFVGWSGDCADGNPACTLSMTRDASAEARFEPVRTLTINTIGLGAVGSDPEGISCGTGSFNRCAAAYLIDTVVTLTAYPAASYTLVRWEGACTGTGPCVVTMSESRNVKAVFATTNTLSVTYSGEGTVTGPGIDCGSDCVEPFLSTTTVTLVATPAPGRSFIGWSGACTGSGSCMVAMTQPRNVNAIFSDGCTQTVTNTESATVFNARLQTPNATICLVNGVTISGQVVVGADGITIRGTQTTVFSNPNGTAIDVGSHTGFRLEGASVQANGPQFTDAIKIGAGASVAISSASVLCLADNCIMVHVTGGAVTITSTSISGNNGAWGVGVYVDGGGSAQVSKSSVLASGNALYAVQSATATVTESVLVGTLQATVLIYSGSTLDLSSSTLHANNVAIQGGGPGLPVTLRIDGNLIRKRPDATMPSSPIISERIETVFHSSQPNTFCGPYIQPLISGPHSSTSTFGTVAHVLQGTCP